MKLALIPLLIAVLLMASTDPDIETVELVFTGEHQITEHRGALVVAGAQVIVPSDEQVSGPIHVIGGELVVAGQVDTDVIQLAGTVTVEPGADIDGELRHIGGTQDVSASSQIGRSWGTSSKPSRTGSGPCGMEAKGTVG